MSLGIHDVSSSLGQVPCIPVSETSGVHPVFTLSMVIKLAGLESNLKVHGIILPDGAMHCVA